MGNANSVYGAKNAAALVNPTSASVFVQTINSAKAASVYFDPFPISGGTGTSVNVLRFILFAWGRATSGTTSNFLAKIQYGTSVTAGSNTDVFTLTNRSYVSTSSNWFVTADCIWDATSQKIDGNGSGNNLNTLETGAAITQVTGVDLTQSNLGFSIAAVFGSSNASNVCYLDGFVMENR